MRDFEYLAPSTLVEALQLLSQAAGQARLLAGGTDLLVRMKDGTVNPGQIIDLRQVAELRGIREEGGMIWIGAMTRHSEVASSPLIQAKAPLFSEACRLIGSWQIRNLGTLAGNLVNASPAADSVPPLFTLDAEVILANHRGERTVPVALFAEGPGRTCLGKDELLTSIRFQPLPETAVSFFLRAGQRRALAISKTSLAFTGILDDRHSTWKEVRIALGAVAPTVIRAHRAETYLVGKPLSRKALEEAAAIVSEEAKPIADVRSTIEYRRLVTGNLLIQGLWPLMKED
ncbi:MAG: xanthine dehydrogenase family protein subunit M [Coprothermobacterota bacterium]|nr:xanthine dehydrogenase family protein subunit M [Coprothermobacterota bacterium]